MIEEHLSIEILTEYFLGKLDTSQEREVRAHLYECNECSKKLSAIRKLYSSFFVKREKYERKRVEEIKPRHRGIFIRVIRSKWTIAAASIILIAGISFASYKFVKSRQDIYNSTIIEGKESENLFSTDTFDKQDTIQYFEQEEQ